MKRYFPSILRKDRKNLAWKGRQRPEYFYKTLIYVDESSVTPLPGRAKCLTRKGEHPVEEDPRWGCLNFKLHYLLAVQPYTGLHHFELLSSSKGHKKHGRYKVSIQFVTISVLP